MATAATNTHTPTHLVNDVKDLHFLLELPLVLVDVGEDVLQRRLRLHQVGVVGVVLGGSVAKVCEKIGS